MFHRKPKRIDASYTSGWREQKWFDISNEIEKMSDKKSQTNRRNPKRHRTSNLQNQGRSNKNNFLGLFGINNSSKSYLENFYTYNNDI